MVTFYSILRFLIIVVTFVACVLWTGSFFFVGYYARKRLFHEKETFTTLSVADATEEMVLLL